MIGIPEGTIGERLYLSKIYLDTAQLFAWTAVILILSMLSERIVLWLLKRAGVGGAADGVWSIPGRETIRKPAGAGSGDAASGVRQQNLHHGAFRVWKNHAAASDDGTGAAR